jgi:hypothetical protein
VVQQVRTVGSTQTLSRAVDDWQQRLTARGVAMLDAASRLSDYLTLDRFQPVEDIRDGPPDIDV